MIHVPPRDTARPDLDAAIATIAAGAAERDRDPSGAFPTDAVDTLAAAGAMQVTAGPNPVSYAEELALLRSVAAADTGVARILDGHLNAVERLRVHAPSDLRDAELAAIATGGRRAGVWGADPVPGEGEPARVAGGALLRDEDLLLGRRRPGAGDRPRAGRRRGRPRRRLGRPHGGRDDRDRPPLVPRRGDALVGQPSRDVRPARRSSPSWGRRARSSRSRGSPATRCAPPRPGRAPPTRRSATRSRGSPRAPPRATSRPSPRAGCAPGRRRSASGSAPPRRSSTRGARRTPAGSPPAPGPRSPTPRARSSTRPSARPARAPPPPDRCSTAPRATCGCSCSSTASSRSSRGPEPPTSRRAGERRHVRGPLPRRGRSVADAVGPGRAREGGSRPVRVRRRTVRVGRRPRRRPRRPRRRARAPQPPAARARRRPDRRRRRAPRASRHGPARAPRSPSCRTTCPARPSTSSSRARSSTTSRPPRSPPRSRWLDGAVAPAGRVVAVHWTGSAPDLQRSADDVHAALARRPRLTRIATTRAATYRLDVLAADA